jgi:hypothetical protein
MNGFKDRLARFMDGRYGQDQLYRALLFLCVGLTCIGLFAKSPVISAAMWLLLVLAVGRSMSRNIEARSRENEKYLAATRGLRKELSLASRKMRGFRSWRYRRCPRCKALIEIPRARGRRVIDCPRCHRVFETRLSWF